MLCVRDDDLKTFEFCPIDDRTDIVGRVAQAIENWRHVRCYALDDGPDAMAREARYLAAKGYRQEKVQL